MHLIIRFDYRHKMISLRHTGFYIFKTQLTVEGEHIFFGLVLFCIRFKQCGLKVRFVRTVTTLKKAEYMG